MDNDQDRPQTRRTEKRSRSPQGKTLPRNVVRKDPDQLHLPWAPSQPAAHDTNTKPCEEDKVTKEAEAFSHSVQADRGDHGAKPGGARSVTTRVVAPEEAPGALWPDTSIPEDLEPQAITLQDVRDYLEMAGEEERAPILAELVPDTRKAGNQATQLLAHWSFPSQIPPPSFTISQNPDESVTLEHTSIHIRILDPLARRE